MQKKIIALAVAGLVSGVAFAQSNVTVYGIADMGFQYSSKSIVDGTKSQSAFNDGGQDGSRFGFKGSEDLGNGLKANFNLEAALPLDTTTSGLKGRNSYVSLSGESWGEVKLGSMGSVHDDYNGFSEAGGMGWGNGAIGMLTTGDYGNAMEYISPTFSGLQFKLGVSTQLGRVAEVEPLGTITNQRAFFGSAAYVNGPLKLAATYEQNKGQATNTTSFKKNTEWLLAAGYDFGVVKLGAGLDQSKFGEANYKRTAWRFNVGAPIGANDAVALSYSHVKFKDLTTSDTAKASGWGASYSHAMSKRTNVYASYGQVSQDQDLKDSYVSTANVGLSQGLNGSYERAFKVGVRHFF